MDTANGKGNLSNDYELLTLFIRREVCSMWGVQCDRIILDV